MPNENEIKTGRYRHYKGKDYDIIGVATHSETGERVVVYLPCYGDRELWVRPLLMFNEFIVINGVSQRRFEYVGDQL